MIEKINPTIPIPITSSPIPDEQREIIMAKSSIAIPNPIFFIVNPPLQIPIFVLCDFPINGNFSLLHFRSNKQHYCHKKINTKATISIITPIILDILLFM